MKRLLAIASFIVLLGAGCAAAPPAAPPSGAQPAQPTAETGTTTVPATPPAPAKPPVTKPVAHPPDERTVIFTKDGTFDPQNIAIHVGGTVTWINQSNQPLWVASNPHPVHTGYPGFDEKQPVANGNSWSFTFDNAGDWGYHNHMSPFAMGKVEVTPWP